METALYIIGGVILFVALCWGGLYFIVWNESRKLTYRQIRDRLRGLTKCYNNFSEEDRKTKTAKQVLKSIHYLEKRRKKIESSTGRSTEGGGNYNRKFA